MALCNCRVCNTIREVDSLCTRLDSEDSDFVKDLWTRMATAEEDAEWERCRKLSSASACSSGQGISMKLPAWAHNEVSFEARLRGMSVKKYILFLVLEDALRVREEHKLLYERLKLISVLQAKLGQVQTLLANFYQVQSVRESSAASLVDSLMP